MPEQYFGDILMFMDFVENFSKFLFTKDFFPGGISLELMERALMQQEIAGPFTDIIHMLLTALFHVQDEEARQYGTSLEKHTPGNFFCLNEIIYCVIYLVYIFASMFFFVRDFNVKN